MKFAISRKNLRIVHGNILSLILPLKSKWSKGK